MNRRAAGGGQTPATAVLRKRAAMVASIWIQCASGSAYCFGIYSPLLKSSQKYDQTTLDTVAFFKDLGANAGVIAGAVYSSSPDAGRPRLVLAAGAVQCFAGYFLIWLSIAGIIYRPPVPLMCLFMFLAAHSLMMQNEPSRSAVGNPRRPFGANPRFALSVLHHLTFFNTADVVTAARNFSDHRGTAIGIMKGYLGLSGAILIEVYRIVFTGDPSYFLLVLALLPTTLALLLMYFVRVDPTNCNNDKPLLNIFSLIALITAGYLMTVIILENILTFEFSIHILLLLLLLIFIASPISIIIKDHLRDSTIISDNNFDQRLLLVDSIDSSETTKVGSSHELNLFQAIRTFEFWLLFISVACGMGSGLATVNNLSQIGSSMGYKRLEINTLVSLWSIWNFIGRFGAGYISDYFLHSHDCARPLFMSITLTGMTIGHGLIASGFPGALYVGSLVIGVCYGSQWCLMPTIASELFGFRHLGTIFNMLAIASPCGSYVLSVRVVGYIYDAESHDRACMGNHCFMLSFVIMALVSFAGFGISLVLFFRTRKFYEQVLCARLRPLTDS